MSNGKFRLIHEEGYNEEEIADGESIDEVLEKAAKKSGRGSLWEAIDEL